MKKYEAMVLSCMDPRFQPKVYKYLKTKKLIGKYSAFTIAGAAIGVTHRKFKKYLDAHFQKKKKTRKVSCAEKNKVTNQNIETQEKRKR